MTWVSTFLYLEQQAFVAKVFSNANERTRFFAGIDFYVQAASLTIQFLLFGRLFKWLACARSWPRAASHDGRLRAVRADAGVTVLVLVYAVRRVATTPSRGRAATRCSPW